MRASVVCAVIPLRRFLLSFDMVVLLASLFCLRPLLLPIRCAVEGCSTNDSVIFAVGAARAILRRHALMRTVRSLFAAAQIADRYTRDQRYCHLGRANCGPFECFENRRSHRRGDRTGGARSVSCSPPSSCACTCTGTCPRAGACSCSCSCPGACTCTGGPFFCTRPEGVFLRDSTRPP